MADANNSTSLPVASPLIALVEDEEHLATGLIFNLRAEGYRTHLEGDGDRALEYLLGAPEKGPERVDAVLLDCMLPGRDGFAIVRALREAGRYTPVLMLTARSGSGRLPAEAVRAEHPAGPAEDAAAADGLAERGGCGSERDWSGGRGSRRAWCERSWDA